MKDQAIEDYLLQLEEYGLEAEDSDDDNLSDLHYTRDELLSKLDDENDDEDCKEVNENDTPLVEEMVEEQESQSRVPRGAIFNTLLDKRKLIWKNRDMEFD